jgi:Mce-associated membrane protein
MSESSRPRPRPGPRPNPPAPPPAIEPTPAAASARPGRWRLAATTVAVLVVAALVALNIWFLLLRSDNADVEAARSAALASAKQRVPALLTYSYTAMDEYLAAAPENTTGSFRTAFSQLVKKVIVPDAKQQHIVTRATVKSAGIIEAGSDRVVVLVLLDQVTTSKASKTGRLDGSRVTATLQHVAGKWLIANMYQI